MANIYLRSTDGNDADNGTTWALAKATLTGALAIAAAGDTIYVSQSHSESTASAISLTSPGTAGNYVRIICGNDGAEPPTAVATTALVATTGASAISFLGFAYVYGITFQAGSGANSAAINWQSTSPWGYILDNCTLKLNNSNAGSRFNFGIASTAVDDLFLTLINTPLTTGATGQTVNCFLVRFTWIDTPSALNGTIPTTLFTPTLASGGPLQLIKGVDLSAAGSGKSLVNMAIGSAATFRFVHCKLNSAIAITTGTPVGQGGTNVELINCDSGDTNYRHEFYQYCGNQVTNTAIYRNGGASNGTTPFSWLLTTLRTQLYMSGFTTYPVIGWNDTTGSRTFTMQYVHGESAVLQDNQIWLEVEYLNNGSFPLSTTATDRNTTILTSAANQTADSAQDWDDGATARANSTAYSLGDIRKAATPNGRIFVITTAGTSSGSEPGGFTTASDGDSVTDNTATWRCMRREKVNVTVTVNEKGPYTARVVVATNVSVYIDPYVTVS